VRERVSRLRALRRRPWLDPAIGLVLGVLTVTPVVDRLHDPLQWAAALAAGTAIAFAVAVRARAPLAALVGCCVIFVAATAAHGHPDVSDASLLAVILLVYTAASRLPAREAYAAAAVALATMVVIEALGTQFDPAPPLVFTVPVVVCARALRRWRLMNVALEQRAAALAQGREAHAALAVADERMRIARELHDVVGHAVSVMVVQATAGRRVADRRPDDARRALDAIEQAGAQALDDLAQLAVLVADDTAAPVTLQGLIVTARTAGIDVALQAGSAEVALPSLGVRVVQEALTNTLKHAGPTEVEIDLHSDGAELTIRVLDSGPRPGHVPAVAVPGGHGLLGMRERVALARGTLSAGPLAGGWEVVARVPAGDHVSVAPTVMASAAPV
jgi:signal transduction histidine kinase